jgi:hypothetical protein
MSNLVTRTFGTDFIYFDLIFLAIWIGLLIRKKYYSPIRWGLAGWLIYILVDYLLWYRIMGSRHYSGSLSPMLFFLWFCFSPGFVQTSYVIVMFERRNIREVLFWTLLFYCGWTLVGILSRWLTLNDELIRVSRDMGRGNQRWIMGSLALLNLLIGVVMVWMKKIKWSDLAYIFLTGTLVELALELCLLIPGIRLEQGHWDFKMMIVNALTEFNCGIVFTYLIWRGLNKKPIGVI